MILPSNHPTPFDDALTRIHFLTGTRTQMQLAEVLGIRQSSISDAKRRQSIPSDWLLKLLTRFWINPRFIQSGEGEMYLTETAEPGGPPMPVTPPEQPGPQDFSTETLLQELADRYAAVGYSIQILSSRQIEQMPAANVALPAQPEKEAA